jgi:hypothetical protein
MPTATRPTANLLYWREYPDTDPQPPAPNLTVSRGAVASWRQKNIICINF